MKSGLLRADIIAYERASHGCAHVTLCGSVKTLSHRADPTLTGAVRTLLLHEQRRALPGVSSPQPPPQRSEALRTPRPLGRRASAAAHDATEVASTSSGDVLTRGEDNPWWVLRVCLVQTARAGWPKAGKSARAVAARGSAQLYLRGVTLDGRDDARARHRDSWSGRDPHRLRDFHHAETTRAECWVVL